MLLLAVTLYCCKNESGTPGKVVIVSTNDMHAQLARFPLLATLIQQKKTEGGEVIVVDAGVVFRVILMWIMLWRGGNDDPADE